MSKFEILRLGEHMPTEFSDMPLVIDGQHIQQKDLEALKIGLHEASRNGGVLTRLGNMNVLWSGDWNGAISAQGESLLLPEESATYIKIAHESMVPSTTGARRRCMDGRGNKGYEDSAVEDFTAPLGPQTAGGTVGDAVAYMHAYNTLNPTSPIRFFDAVTEIEDLDASFGFAPGGHALSQCGKYKFAPSGFATLANSPELVNNGVKTFFGAVNLGGSYSEQIQNDLIGYVRSNESQLLIPEAAEAMKRATQVDDACMPELDKVHAERILVVIKKPGMVLHTNHANARLDAELGKPANIFGYNLDFHLQRAEKMHGQLGAYYLHAVGSNDIPVLTNLADGTPEIYLYE